MQFEYTDIPNLVVITPERFTDSRGYFMETFRKDLFDEVVGTTLFVQVNRSLSAIAGTVRGLHYQLQPMAQGKLVQCVQGALIDIAVDIRFGSETFGRHIAVELTAENSKQLWIPPGFAHGFCTLSPNTIIDYKVTNYYSHTHDRGVLWNDPALMIDWPVGCDAAVLSDKDKCHPPLKEVDLEPSY